LNTDLRKFESSQKEESRTQSADSSEIAANLELLMFSFFTEEIVSFQ